MAKISRAPSASVHPYRLMVAALMTTAMATACSSNQRAKVSAAADSEDDAGATDDAGDGGGSSGDDAGTDDAGDGLPYLPAEDDSIDVDPAVAAVLDSDWSDPTIGDQLDPSQATTVAGPGGALPFIACVNGVVSGTAEAFQALGVAVQDVGAAVLTPETAGFSDLAAAAATSGEAVVIGGEVSVTLGDLSSCATGLATLAVAAWNANAKSAARGLQGLLSNVFEARKQKNWVAGTSIAAKTAAINDCTACPPLPSTCRRCDRVPPSPPHYPCAGDHYNVVAPEYNLQKSSCTCFIDFKERSAICVQSCPDSDTVNRCF